MRNLIRASDATAAIMFLFLVGILPDETLAATIHVENNGVDSPSCGAVTEPCRSISHAIASATDGDKIVVGPGRYGDLNGDGSFGGTGEEATPAGCGCMIEVNKRLTLQSSDGPGVSILDAGGAEITGILVQADGVTFGGGSGHGFTIVNARHEGLHVEGNGVTVAGNVAIGNGLSGHVAIAVVGIGNIIADNAAINNANVGIQVNDSPGVNDSSGTVTGNVASANLEGFRINTQGRVQFTQNVASGNRSHGLSSGVGGQGVLEIRRSSFLGNRGIGIVFNFGGTGSVPVIDITDSNIFGNGSCGLQNNTGAVVTASGNFWGAASGPGPDPADTVCNVPPSTTVVDPVATKPFNIPVRAGR